MSNVGTSFFENVVRSFDKAAAFLNYPAGLLEQIKVCNSVYHFQFPVHTESGYEVVSAWRVEHSQHKLPTKGAFDGCTKDMFSVSQSQSGTSAVFSVGTVSWTKMAVLRFLKFAIFVPFLRKPNWSSPRVNSWAFELRLHRSKNFIFSTQNDRATLWESHASWHA